MRKHPFETEDYDFRAIVMKYLGTDDLESLHDNIPLLTEGKDQNTKCHRMFYENMDSNPEFKNLYDIFIKNVVAELFEDEVAYQRFPTFRIHYQDNVGVFAFHKDRDYNHNPREVNFYLPLTRAFETNTIWVESEEDLGDYAPIESHYGQVVEFDGANLRHGSKLNNTGTTRVSFDFRVIARKFCDRKAATSKTQNLRFSIGEYYQEVGS